MKQFLLLLTVLFMLTSCSMEEGDRPNFDIVFIGTDSIAAPAYVTPGTTYPIKMYYKKPNACYDVNGLYSNAVGDVLTLGIQGIYIEDANCKSIDTAVEEQIYSFACPATRTDSYTFKFYQGNDAQGNQQFLEVKIPVQQ